MDDSRILPPIPSPPAQRWREIRLLYLPRITFVLVALLVAWMWGTAVSPSSLVAEAEVLGSDLRAPQAGVIASLKVALHQPVKAGEVVGQLAGLNPRLLEATLAVIRADVAMLAATMSGATDAQRVALEYERMALDWMNHRVDRVALQGRLQQAEGEMSRSEPLMRSGLITPENFDQLKISRDSLRAQLEEKTKLVARLEPVLGKLAANPLPDATLSGESALAAAIKVQESKLRLAEAELAPVPLVAPVDGVVAAILRRPGETVMAGDAVLRVTAPKAERLAGYLRQPLSFEPKVGMLAEIRTRGSPAKVVATKITHIGVALETLSPNMVAAMRLPPTPLPETAVRVEFALPTGLELRPGEHVDVTVREN
ncbi:MAG: HlyD family efflux transporter periplasmic adaptor subunit [Opitutaceae bacterium]